MSRSYEDPKTVLETGPMAGLRTTHPAYGQIVANRVEGDQFLYGSDFMHHSHIRIAISRSEHIRSLSHDYYHSKDEIIEVALSEAQWATFISSLNRGSGPCCTLMHEHRQQVPQIPQVKKDEGRFLAEVEEDAQEARADLAELARMINDSKLSQQQKKDMLWKLEHAERSIGSSLEFVAKSFGKHVENKVDKARMEVEAFVEQKLRSVGVQSIADQKLLTYDASAIRLLEEK